MIFYGPFAVLAETAFIGALLAVYLWKESHRDYTDPS